MDCKQVRELLADWIAGKRVGTDVSAHLRSCAACREEERLFRGTWKLLDHYLPIEPPADFASCVVTRARRPALWKIFTPIAAAAAAAVVAVILFVTPPRPPSPTPVTAEERELVENLELLENYEILSALELLAEESAEGHLFKEEQ